GLHFPALSLGLIPKTGATNKQNLFQALHHQFVASSLVVKYAEEISERLKIGMMTIYATTYAFDSHPKNQMAALEQSQEINGYCCEVQAGGEYPAYTQRIFDKYQVQPLTMAAEDLSLLVKYPVQFIGL